MSSNEDPAPVKFWKSTVDGVRDSLVTLFLGGDVMTGRGVDQILPHPGDPRLWETHVDDARTYVELAEAANGPIARPVPFSWPWGSALEVLDAAAPDACVINLETSVTYSDDFAPEKGVHYRMSPENLPCLSVARPCVYTVANNHVMDFGPRGLEETLSALALAGIATAGAGRDISEARRPAVVTVRDSRVVVLAFGAWSSGIPDSWAATRHRAGVDLLPDLSAATAGEVAARLRQDKRPGDVVVASVHWGSNWGHGVPAEHVGFAHRLIDGGVDVVHGHSSHHPRPIEVYAGKLILYGCGDLIDDYEGIGGYESYRDDLRLQYFAFVEPDSGRLAQLQMVPLQARQMRLHHASSEDAEHLRSVLDRISRDFGSRIARNRDGMLALRSGEI